MHNKEYSQYLQSKIWSNKKLEVFGLKGKKCQRCSSQERLHVHHACYDRFGGEEDIVNDLFVLCENCHNEYHRKNKKVSLKSTKSFIKRKKFKPSKRNTIDTILRSEYIPLRNKKYKVSRF